jgi:Ni,Fe-hydrogenase III small subunit
MVVGSIPGTDVMIFKIFSPKTIAKKLAILSQNKAKLCKFLIITLVFEKNANFFAENWRKSQKIVIITSAPVCAVNTFFV